MIYLITDRAIKKYNTLEEIEEKENLKIDETELKSVGEDLLVSLTNKDIDFVRDKYLLSKIPIEKLYGRNTIEQKEKNKKNIIRTVFTFALLGSLFINVITLGLLFIK